MFHPPANRPMNNLLFVCTQNRVRSFTAEVIFDALPGYTVKSAGTDASARIPLTQEHVDWADMIFVMETEHLEQLRSEHGRSLAGKRIICLDIPDIYYCMEPSLIEELKTKLSEHLEVRD